MACCQEYQTECLKVVTIGYLKSFIGSNVQDNTDGHALPVNHSDNTYCPTYSELIGGTLIQNWKENATTPNKDQDGIVVSGSYTGNQLVRQQDLSLKYTRFSKLEISSNKTSNLNQCGDSAIITTTYKYVRHTKSMNGSCSVTSSSVETNAPCADLTFTASFGSVSNCTDYTIPKNGTAFSAAARTDKVSATTVFRGSTKESNVVSIGQKKREGDWIYSGRSYDNLTITRTSEENFDCSGGWYSARATGYYTDYYYWKDDCGVDYKDKTDTITGQENVGGGTYTCSVNGVSSMPNSGGTTTFTYTKSGGSELTGYFSPIECDCEDTYHDWEYLTATYGNGKFTRSLRFDQYCSKCPDDPKCQNDEDNP